ncbi:MAG: hypothetical protein NTZ78_03595 [Candidatus Aureabacteria bacterium]|nr:hypothetical protein [Candidatus Auribacterota bacterium]
MKKSRRGKNGHAATMRCRTTPCGIAWSSMSPGERINYIRTNPSGFHPYQFVG